MLIGSLLFLAILGYFLGPKVSYEQVDNTPMQLDLPLDQLKTEYAVVYLHGFEASWAESDPIVTNFAQRYGCNLLQARISQQARQNIDALLDETPKGMMDSAKEAIAIGKLLGEKLIVISCSTGATYSTYLAANDPEIYAQIMTSPNFDLNDQNSKLLTKPWGKQILRAIIGDDYREFAPPPGAEAYWNHRYRIDGVIALRALLDQTMTPEIWRKNKTPIFLAYYYKNENDKDDIISIEAVKQFTKEVGTPADKLKVLATPEGHGHVFTSKWMNDKWQATQDEIYAYVEEVLDMSPVAETD